MLRNTTDTLSYNWEYLLRLASRHKKRLVQAHVVALLSAICSVPVPLLMPLLVDEVLLDRPGMLVHTVSALSPSALHGPTLFISSILLLTLLLRAFSLCLNVWQIHQFTIVSKDISFRIRKTLLLKLEHISMSEYETLGTGTVSSRLVTDIETIDQFIGVTIGRFLVAVLTITGVACILLWMHWQIALLILLLNPAVIYFTIRFGKHVKLLKQRENQAFEAFQGALVETLDAIHQVRASNREKHYLKHLIEQATTLRDDSTAFAWKSDAANRLSFTIFLFGFDLFRAIAMAMVLLSDLTIGQMFAVFGYLWFMMAPVQEILNMQYALYAARAALQRLDELLHKPQEPSWPRRENPFQHGHAVGIEVCELHFRYPQGSLVLDGINLHIEAGQTVALAGESGAGKSTLVQILIGLYHTYRGTIRYGGVPIEHIGLDTIRENIATVLQNPAFFNSTIRHNLELGRVLPEQRLWEALHIAQLEDKVRSLEHGLDTVIGRQGLRLSGGQKQRLAIARMILGDPRIVILDEATSALDANTEHQVYSGLASFLEQRTTIIVAHRLNPLRQADTIFVFSGGKICEQGPSLELLSGNGPYAKLHDVYRPSEGWLSHSSA